MRVGALMALALFIVALCACIALTPRSKRAMAPDVRWLLISLLPPMIGNAILIASGDWLLSQIGCYLYYLGLDWSVMALLRFSCAYCAVERHERITYPASALVLVDVIQLLANPFTGHAFDTYPLMVEGYTYWALLPYAGQVGHRIVAYGIFFVSVFLFVRAVVKAPRIYRERYGVILAAMVCVGLWESFYIVSGTPIDLSMLGFGAFGLLVFYFALHYKPFRLLDRMLAQVVSNMEEAIFFFDRDDACIYANAAARELFGVRKGTELQEGVERVRAMVGERDFVLGRPWSCQCAAERSGGLRYWDVDYRLMKDEHDELVGSYLLARDRTAEERDLREQRFFATHDRLTRLYNSEYLYERGRAEMDARPELAWSVVALDVKEFKLVNDIYSSEVGDRVLCHIADIMRAYAQKDWTFGRLSGDKFGCILPTDSLDVDVLEGLLASESFIEEVSFPVTVHAGVYHVSEMSTDLSVMFDRAFMAIASIKNELQRHVAVYDEHMRSDALWAKKISAEVDGAIATGQIRPFLQPLVDDEGVVRGAEVLVRWIHPEEGFLPPYRFIPCFEENGRIAQLDLHMWECACRILRDWRDRGVDLFLSVNISPKDFYFMDVGEAISGLVAKYGIDAEKLRLEITENVMMSDVEQRLRIISELRRQGFLVEMDDFGSGYSSLNMLKDMPVDILKIDMMFLYKAENQGRAKTILQTIVNLSNELGMPSITEGVETKDQLGMLKKMGCRLFQGYYFARPMPVEEFESSYLGAA